IGHLLPGNSLRSHAQMGAWIIKGQNLPIGVPLLSHDLGADLAESDSVTRAATVKDNFVATIAHLVPVALQALPPDVTAYRRTEQQSRHGDASASGDTQELDPTAGGAVQHGHRAQLTWNLDAVGGKCSLQLA